MESFLTDGRELSDAEQRRREALDRVRQAIADGQVSSADAAIDLLRSAGEASDLGAVLLSRFDLTGDPDSLREAVVALHAAVRHEPGRPRLLSNLGLALIRQFELTDEVSTLVEAVSLLRQAVRQRSATGAPRPSYLSNLGLALVRLAERTGDAHLVKEAVECYTAAAELAQEQPASQAAILANLGAAQVVCYRLDGMAARLVAAIDAYQQAVRIVPDDHAYARGCIAGLGDALATAATLQGDVALSVEAMQTLRAAVREMRETDPDGPLFLNQLAEALRRSFTLTGDSEALAESIDCRRTALNRTPHGHPDRLHYQANLALSLRNLFEATGDLDDLRAAHDLIREVLTVAPIDHPERPKWQADIAHVLHRLGIREHEESYLRDAAQLLRAAVARVESEHSDAAMHRNNLGGVLLTALEMRWRPRLYDEAVRTLTTGLRAALIGASERAELLLNLGLVYAVRFRAEGAAEAYRSAADAFGEVVDTPTAPARIRAMAAQHQGNLHVRGGDHAAAVAAFRTALELLDLIAWHGLARDDQERALVEFRELASAAAASAINIGDPDGAVSLLEQGRGVLLGQVLELRSSHDLLSVEEPELARELQQVHDAMESGARARATAGQPGVDPGGPGMAGAEGDSLLDRQRLAIRREQLLAEIRGRDHFTHFLRPPEPSTLRAEAPDGAVVMLNLAVARCDALITTRSGTAVVPLPDLLVRDAAERTASFVDAVNANAWGTNEVLRSTLAWLWEVAVGPVLDRLGEAARVGALTRVWWVPTGTLTLLPVHAAGHHGTGDGDTRSALHRVVSSYSPTLRALSRSGIVRSEVDTTLVVGADSGPVPLAAVVAETAVVTAHRSGPVSALIGAQATRSAVLAQLPVATWVHVAGHAVTDSRRPSESHLSLYDGNLRAREISAMAPATRELAYLSACETAVGGVRLPDESIHIASAFQLAGFRNTIGTLWRVPDRAARDTAAAIYSQLRRNSPAQAVNLAARRLRDTYRANPYEWAAFVHSGSG